MRKTIRSSIGNSDLAMLTALPAMTRRAAMVGGIAAVLCEPAVSNPIEMLVDEYGDSFPCRKPVKCPCDEPCTWVQLGRSGDPALFEPFAVEAL